MSIPPRRFGWRVAAVATAVLAALAGPAWADAPASDPLPQVTPAARAAELMQPATVFVEVTWRARVILGDGLDDVATPVAWQEACSGFVVNTTGYVVTAGHCLDPGPDGAQDAAIQILTGQLVDSGQLTEEEAASILDARESGQFQWRVEGPRPGSLPQAAVYVTVGGGKAGWSSGGRHAGLAARVLEVRPWSDGDVGLLKVDQENLPVALLAPKAEVQVGQSLMAIGYPLALATGDDDVQVALTNRIGQINSVETEGQHGPGNLFYEIDARLTKGMSGGPVTDLDGRVVGLASYRAGDDANYIVPSAVITDVVSARTKNVLGRVDKLYREGLDDYYHGYYTDAIAAFEQVLAITPGLPSVAAKKSEAADRRQRYGDQSKPVAAPVPSASAPPWAAIAAIAAGGLLVLAGAVLLFRRRPGRRDRAGAQAPGWSESGWQEPESPGPERSERPEAERPEPERPEPERPEPERPEPERLGPERPEPERLGPERPEPEWLGPERLGPERPEPEWPEPEQLGPERPEPEWLGPDRSGPDGQPSTAPAAPPPAGTAVADRDRASIGPVAWVPPAAENGRAPRKIVEEPAPAPADRRFCTECGARSAPTARFCSRCGARLAAPTQ